MNKNSNIYIIGYATALVVVVAAVLAFAATSLKPRQVANVLIEKKGAILASIGEAKDIAKAKNKDKYIDEEYTKYIKASFFVNAAGERTDVDAKMALDALDNLAEVFAKKEAMPIFETQTSDGKELFVVPVYGKGLWGPVWGYVALKSDLNTIEGAVFDHKGETPGLGAEIALPQFSNQFIGKTIFENENFVSVTLTKGVGSSAGNNHAVDAISGGTLTSNGVRDMLKACLGDYVPFFKKIKNGVSITILNNDNSLKGIDSEERSCCPSTDNTKSEKSCRTLTEDAESDNSCCSSAEKSAAKEFRGSSAKNSKSEELCCSSPEKPESKESYSSSTGNLELKAPVKTKNE